MQYNSGSGVCEDILTMKDITVKMRQMDVGISDGFLVYFILASLPNMVNSRLHTILARKNDQ